jgi:hypothetical protein
LNEYIAQAGKFLEGSEIGRVPRMSQIGVTEVKVDEIHKGWLKSFVVLLLERLPLHTQLLILLKIPRVVEDGGQTQYAFKEVGLFCIIYSQRNEHCPSATVSRQSDAVGVDLIFARVINEPRNGTLQMEDGSGELVFGAKGKAVTMIWKSGERWLSRPGSAQSFWTALYWI